MVSRHLPNEAFMPKGKEEFGLSGIVGAGEDEAGDGSLVADGHFDDPTYGEAVGVVEEHDRDVGLGRFPEGVVVEGGSVPVDDVCVADEDSAVGAADFVVACADGDGGVAGIADDAVTSDKLAGGLHGRDRCCRPG